MNEYLPASEYPYPSPEDARYADSVDAFYDSPYFKGGQRYRAMFPSEAPRDSEGKATGSALMRAMMNGEEVGTQYPAARAVPIDENMKMAALAARRSAIAAMGLDPQRYITVLDGRYQGANGFYNPDADRIATSLVLDSGGSSNPTHEALHRGIAMLKKREDMPKEMRAYMEYRGDPKHTPRDFEEMLVRRMMQKRMGDPEVESRPDEYTKLLQKYGLGFDIALDDLEKYAAGIYAKEISPYGRPR
jgi:hypothetical protein